MSAVFPILVAQYYVGHGPNGMRPYGWHIVVQTGHDRRGDPIGTAYYVRGTTVGQWELQVERNVRFRATSAYRGAARVGSVDAMRLGELEYQLTRAEIVQHSPDWGYQEWVCGALRRLYARDFPIQDLVWKRMRTVMKGAEEAYDMFRD